MRSLALRTVCQMKMHLRPSGVSYIADHQRPVDRSFPYTPLLVVAGCWLLSRLKTALGTASASSTSNMLTYIAELDDNSLSFHYIGPWSPVKGSSSDFQSTLHSTTQEGASAAVRFIGKIYLRYRKLHSKAVKTYSML